MGGPTLISRLVLCENASRNQLRPFLALLLFDHVRHLSCFALPPSAI
jgi:hypothetical protein